jgi:hypothetical protein
MAPADTMETDLSLDALPISHGNNPHIEDFTLLIQIISFNFAGIIVLIEIPKIRPFKSNGFIQFPYARNSHGSRYGQYPDHT